MTVSEDEAEFEMLFGTKYAAKSEATKTRIEGRIKAERRATFSDGQRSRGGATRSENMNFRVTPAFKALAFGLATHMSEIAGRKVSIADMLEEAVAALAKKKSFKAEKGGAE